MYNIESVLQKLNSTKKDSVNKTISCMNKEIINEIMDRYNLNDTYKIIFNNLFEKTQNKLIENILAYNGDVNAMILEFVEYYDEFCKSFIISQENGDYNLRIDGNLFENGVINAIDTIRSIDTVTKTIRSSCEQWIKNNFLFDDFKTFTTVIGNSTLSKNEQFYIVMDIIYKNLKLDLEKYITNKNVEFYSVDASQILGINENEFIDIFNNDKCNYLLNTDSSKLTELEKKQKLILMNLKEIKQNECNDFNIYDTVHTYNDIKTNYFDKLDANGNLQDFNNDSYNIVISSLKKLGVNDKILNIAKNKLKKQIKYIQQNNVSKNENRGITDAEYTIIRKQIEEFYDIHNCTVAKPLSEEDVLYCASLMLKIDVDIKTIKALFDRGLNRIDDPVKRYEQEKDKLLYYQEKLGIENQVDEINQFYEEILVASDDDKKVWTSMLDGSLKDVEYKLPKYEYELKKAKEFKKIK